MFIRRRNLQPLFFGKVVFFMPESKVLGVGAGGLAMFFIVREAACWL
jgi:hypothetical protein